MTLWNAGPRRAGRAEEALPLDEPVTLPVGSEVIVSVKGSTEPDWFYVWDADGTLIDGSALPGERFHVPPQGTTVQPRKRGISPLTIPTSPNYLVTWDGVGPMGHLVEAGPNNTVLVPEGAYLKVHATSPKYMLAGWTGLATDREWTSHTPSTNMRADVDSFEPSFVQSLGPFFTGYLTHTARATKGGVAFIGDEDRANHYGDGLQLGSWRSYAFHPSLPFYWGYAKLDAKADLGYEFSHWTVPAIIVPPIRESLLCSVRSDAVIYRDKSKKQREPYNRSQGHCAKTVYGDGISCRVQVADH
ncbi:MAG: hypothetical protein KJ052_07895 [Candidatus Hydrogenedentes bacterium]|nr:hypothetical protein [Candidatus Hydrogenedentota bacterium]